MTNFITENRTLLEAVRNSHKNHGIEYKFFADGWILRLNKNEKTHFIYVYGFDINSQATANIASDKVATFELLDELNISTVPHYLLTNVMDRDVHIEILENHLSKYSEIVLKPTRGSRGEGIARVGSSQASINHISNNNHISWAVSPYINIKKEIRVVSLDENILLAYEKYDPVEINGLRMYNLNLGAKAKKISIVSVDTKYVDLAKKAMKAIGLKLGAVDIVIDDSDNAYVLEINSAFSLEHFALTNLEDRKTVLNFYEIVIEHLFNN